MMHFWLTLSRSPENMLYEKRINMAVSSVDLIFGATEMKTFIKLEL